MTEKKEINKLNIFDSLETIKNNFNIEISHIQTLSDNSKEIKEHIKNIEQLFNTLCLTVATQNIMAEGLLESIKVIK